MTFSERILQLKKEYIYAGISILLWPIMAVLFACIILKDKMTLRKAVVILLSLIWTSLVLKEDLSIYYESNKN